MGECIMPTNGVFAVVNNGGIIEEGDEINVYSSQFVTLSDKGSIGEREDLSGKNYWSIRTIRI